MSTPQLSVGTVPCRECGKPAPRLGRYAGRCDEHRNTINGNGNGAAAPEAEPLAAPADFDERVVVIARDVRPEPPEPEPVETNLVTLARNVEQLHDEFHDAVARLRAAIARLAAEDGRAA